MFVQGQHRRRAVDPLGLQGERIAQHLLKFNRPWLSALPPAEWLDATEDGGQHLLLLKDGPQTDSHTRQSLLAVLAASLDAPQRHLGLVANAS